MTFWDALAKAYEYVSDRITRILGLAGGTISVLAASNVIPPDELKYWMASIAVITFWRGQATGKVYQQAKTIVANGTSTPQPPEKIP